jgi:hypothetical protein
MVVSVKVPLAIVVVVVVVAPTTCKTLPPPEAAAHFKPVASALSATNLIREQSQRIVLDTGIIPYL